MLLVAQERNQDLGKINIVPKGALNQLKTTNNNNSCKTIGCDSYLCNLEQVEMLCAVLFGAAKQYLSDGVTNLERPAQGIK